MDEGESCDGAVWRPRVRRGDEKVVYGLEDVVICVVDILGNRVSEVQGRSCFSSVKQGDFG